MSEDKEIPWEGRCLDEADKFASACAKLRDSNPYDRPALNTVIVDLVAELWDRFFSQTEIRTAFESALSGLPRYAAGEERRGDRERSR